MVRRADEVCIKYLLAAWSRAAAIGLDRDEHRVDVRQNIGSVHCKNPPACRVVINGEVAQALRLAEIRLAIAPGLENTALVILPVLQIKGVEHKKSFLNVVHASVSALRFPVTRYVVHIDDVQVARAKEISRLDFRGRGRGPS